ncbi:MAG: hypothetical protein QM724_03860 [Flavobacteriales bacterium]
MTVVGTALSRDEEGGLCHLLVVDTTLPDEVEVAYEVLPRR